MISTQFVLTLYQTALALAAVPNKLATERTVNVKHHG